MNAKAPRAYRFETLDLLRGIAAISVLVYHSDIFLGFHTLPNAYMAVDMFFILSGFVIAHNYDPRFDQGMSIRDFMLLRVIRLYPCYLLALFAGLVLGVPRLMHLHGYLDVRGVLGAAVANLVMLPRPFKLYGEIVAFFPFNGASWSLMFEMLASFLYCLTFRALRSRALLLVILVAAVIYILGARRVGTVDLGMRSADVYFGIARVVTTFFGGVAIRRYLHDFLPFRLGGIGIVVVTIFFIWTFSFSYIPGAPPLVVGELLTVLLLYPLMLTLVSNSVTDGLLAKVCRFAGNVSYPVYLLQGPGFFVFAAIPEVLFHTKAINWAPAWGYVEMVIVILVAWVVDRHFELPVRMRLRTWIFGARRV